MFDIITAILFSRISFFILSNIRLRDTLTAVNLKNIFIYSFIHLFSVDVKLSYSFVYTCVSIFILSFFFLQSCDLL